MAEDSVITTGEANGSHQSAASGSAAADAATRALLFMLLLLIVGVVLFASILFSDASRVFLLKSAAAVLLSLIPGWIYLQFLRNKGQSLYDEYVINLFRLEIDAVANLPAPPQHTTWYRKWRERHTELIDPEVKDNLYRRKFEAVYGSASVSTIGLLGESGKLSLRQKTETFGPVVMATLLIALGWVLVLQPELLRDISLLSTDYELSGRPVLPGDGLRMAFIGAYSFIILDLGRRYFRDDLKAAAYLSATTRVVFASALVVVVDAAGLTRAVTDGQASALAFFIGFFPRAGFTWLRNLIPAKYQASIPQLESDYPLRNLEGLNIWYETRLIEEGIDSIQNLCSANLVDLMLKTRLPVMRIVDWVDQAYLHLHLPASSMDGGQPPAGLEKLRRLGIRTATDLQRVWEQDPRPDGMDALLAAALVPEEPDKVTAVMSSLLRIFDGESNLWHVRAFRRLQWLKEDGADRDDTRGRMGAAAPLPGDAVPVVSMPVTGVAATNGGIGRLVRWRDRPVRRSPSGTA